MRVFRWLVPLLAVFLASCGGGGGDANPTAPPPGTETTFTVSSQHTGLAYSVTVWVPASYASAASLPVVYALDREFQHGVVRGEVEGRGLAAIVVSVSHISAERRFVDFQLPGAEAYFRFVTLELLPFVEAQYRVDRTRRVLAGYSLSGLFGVLAFLMDNPADRVFSGFVITDPSLQFHTDTTFAMEAALAASTRRVPVAYFACYTSPREPFPTLHERIQSRAYEGMRIQHRLYGLDHGAVLRPCVEDGMRFVFGP
jgi:predicted alpha/beta superfamily hydrolase